MTRRRIQSAGAPRAGRDGWGSAAVLVAACALVTLAAAPKAAAAQVADAWTRATPIEAFGVWRSARLEAMGGLRVAVEDRFRRLNAYDYAANPAGLLSMPDSSWVEQGSEYASFEDRYFDVPHSAILRRSGVRGAIRAGENWALGADVIYGSVTASRHDFAGTPDNGRFIRDFDIPFATTFQPVTSDRTIGANVRYPSIALSYARRARPWLTLAARLGYREETEDRKIADPYDLDTESRAAEYAGGVLLAPPYAGGIVQIGGFGQYVSHRVTARSESPLNDDEYDWNRPQVGYGAHVLVDAGWLRGIVDGRHRSYDGEQVARVNWAPQFFMNPFPSTTDPRFVFRRRWSSFLSGLRHNEASTRWMAEIAGRARAGLEWGTYRQIQWIRPNPGVLQLALPLDVRRLGTHAGAGVSVDVTEGGLVAAEARLERDFRSDRTGGLEDVATETLSYHFGGEYRVRSWLPVRAGVALLRHDPDRRDGHPSVKGIRGSVGAGIRWTGVGAEIDAAYAHEHFSHSPLDPSREVGSGDQIILTISHLF